MPFTFAHPALVLPINKKINRYFDLIGLVIGSMSPDFEYFIRLTPVSKISHTFNGILFFDLPLSIILVFLFHSIVKKQLIINLPSPLNIWYEGYIFNEYKLNNFRKIIMLIYSILTGAFSHILWDSFTHEGGFFVNNNSLLKYNLIINELEIPVYKILQHGSTIFGFIIIALYLYSIRSRKNKSFTIVKTRTKILYWVLIVAVTILITTVIIFYKNYSVSVRYVGPLIVSIITSGIISIITVSMLFNKYNE